MGNAGGGGQPLSATVPRAGLSATRGDCSQGPVCHRARVSTRGANSEGGRSPPVLRGHPGQAGVTRGPGSVPGSGLALGPVSPRAPSSPAEPLSPGSPLVPCRRDRRGPRSGPGQVAGSQQARNLPVLPALGPRGPVPAAHAHGWGRRPWPWGGAFLTPGPPIPAAPLTTGPPALPGVPLTPKEPPSCSHRPPTGATVHRLPSNLTSRP